MINLVPNPICHCSDEKTKLLQVKIINKCNSYISNKKNMLLCSTRCRCR